MKNVISTCRAGHTLWLALCLVAFVVGVGSAAKIEMPTGWNEAALERLLEGKTGLPLVAIPPLDLASHPEFSKDFPEINLEEMLVTGLAQTNRFSLIERSRLDQIFAEQNMALAGLTNVGGDEDEIVQFGRLTGAEYVIVVTLSSIALEEEDKFGYNLITAHVRLDGRAVNVNTGEIVFSCSGEGTESSKIFVTASGEFLSGSLNHAKIYTTAAQNAVASLSSSLATNVSPTIGFVVHSDGKLISADAGMEQGVRPGMQFVVFERGEKLVHPATGAFLGYQKNVLCEVSVVSAEQGLSTLKIGRKNRKARSPKVGDLVIQVLKN
jgi:hypothetical protein